MQRPEVDPPIRLLIAPVRDYFRMRRRLQTLPAAPVSGPRQPALPMVPHRPLAHAQKPRHRALRMTPFQQHCHRRPSLDPETTHRPPPATTAGKSIRPRRHLANLDVALRTQSPVYLHGTAALAAMHVMATIVRRVAIRLQPGAEVASQAK